MDLKLVNPGVVATDEVKEEEEREEEDAKEFGGTLWEFAAKETHLNPYSPSPWYHVHSIRSKMASEKCSSWQIGMHHYLVSDRKASSAGPTPIRDGFPVASPITTWAVPVPGIGLLFTDVCVAAGSVAGGGVYSGAGLVRCHV
ncbi:hypothetical protein NCU04709 [Neurospora crassa OR74A]|uniref:Uncharacterized protein n=1 Tax=Neurospora crassa (strain ATCC 24698 / 74-OR23-1A / CBS 708.71 / DSM 1257 / FGSC 987) TaxID=367110 RepID=Q7S651_NEUCR|nr:hypothetical protein NCU04709 [Neurospora crassa OR74A]EAA31004.3 hypothetical protein NCU04709 [Neurospora crassa OR74A]|eukprot:XP_960240.3 hypothetical protein NCU04709 [Neurospora crassa OR74A]